jgi:hypothetical protein
MSDDQKVESTSEEQGSEKNYQITSAKCAEMFRQIEAVYAPTLVRANDTFIVWCHKEETERNKYKGGVEDPIGLEVRTMCQTLSLFAVSRLRNTSNFHATRQLALFLSQLETASHHLEKALRFAQ